MVDKFKINSIISNTRNSNLDAYLDCMVLLLLKKIKENKKCLILGVKKSFIFDRMSYYVSNKDLLELEIEHKIFCLDFQKIYDKEINIYNLESFIKRNKIDFLFLAELDTFFTHFFYFFIKKPLKKEVLIEKKEQDTSVIYSPAIHKRDFFYCIRNLIEKTNIGVLCGQNRDISHYYNINNFDNYFDNIFYTEYNGSCHPNNYVDMNVYTKKSRTDKYDLKFKISKNIL